VGRIAVGGGMADGTARLAFNAAFTRWRTKPGLSEK
jgi:hypothetical protein